MKAVTRYMKPFGVSVVAAFVALGLAASPAAAQNAKSGSSSSSSHHDHDNGQSSNALIDAVRQSTARFRDVRAAEGAGYGLQFGCVSGSDFGAMGMHFVNGPLVADGEIDVTRPEIVIYEPQPNGRLKLIGADFLVLADQWNATHDGPPQLMGQLFHLFEAPNRFGLPNFYTLHVWAWKPSPTGAFVNWHADVSCDAFDGER